MVGRLTFQLIIALRSNLSVDTNATHRNKYFQRKKRTFFHSLAGHKLDTNTLFLYCVQTKTHSFAMSTQYFDDFQR